MSRARRFAIGWAAAAGIAAVALAEPAPRVVAAEPWSMCLVTTDLDGPPRRVLQGETLEFSLRVHAYCRAREQPGVGAIVVAIEPGHTTASLADAKRELLGLYARHFESPKTYIGIAVPGRGGGVSCPVARDPTAVRRCLERIDRIDPVAPLALEDALRGGLHLQDRWRPAPWESPDARRWIVLLTLTPPSSSSGGAFSDPACRAARRLSDRIRDRGILLVTGDVRPGSRIGRGELARCLRDLATSPRYFLPNMGWLDLVGTRPPATPSSLPVRSMALELRIPSALDVEHAAFDPDNARGTVELVDGRLRAEAGWVGSEGASISLRARLPGPGAYDLPFALSVDWEEALGVRSSAQRDWSRSVTVLRPRPIARSEPVDEVRRGRGEGGRR